MEHQLEQVRQAGKAIRRYIVEMIGVGTPGHIGGSCSSADIVAALYFYKMRLDPKNPSWRNRDRFIMSKGHSVPAQYAALALLGFFPKDELFRLKTLGSFLQGHPDLRKTPGIEANTGSLGQGLSVALGLALSIRLDSLPSRVYCLLGDGELNEGQVWEAAMAAKHFKCANLCAVIDHNGIQATGPLSQRLDICPIGDKWRSFGWNVLEINGHDYSALCEAFDQAEMCQDVPTVIVAKTIKGKGISFAENSAAFHNAALSQEQFQIAINDIEVNSNW